MKKIYKLTELTKPGELTKLLSSVIYYISILIFIIGFGFTDTPTPFGWYQQFTPNLNNQPLQDICFVDSLNGWAVTGTNTSNDSGYVLKTTNSGDNWTIILKNRIYFNRVDFLNTGTGIISGFDYRDNNGHLYKSTDGGNNWITLNVPGGIPINDISVLNIDTLWIVSEGGLVGGIFMSTNGGLNWITQYNTLSDNPNKIYMFNSRIGFACTTFKLLKTTNSGQNWNQIGGSSESNAFFDMYFADSLTGWKSNLPSSDTNMVKTTDGGFNWYHQTLPHGGLISTSSGMNRFSKISKDTIWGTNGALYYGNGRYRGIIWVTTNGGNNWYFQLPDTSFGIPVYFTMNFINNKIGWSYAGSGIHTITGGDTVFYTGIIKSGKNIPKNYILKQNYPNPFNPRTVIPYSIKSSGYVKLIAYDILGKEVQRLVDQKQEAGEYEVDFMGKFSASGVYFYRIEVTDDKSKQLFSETKTMVLIK